MVEDFFVVLKDVIDFFLDVYLIPPDLRVVHGIKELLDQVVFPQHFNSFEVVLGFLVFNNVFLFSYSHN